MHMVSLVPPERVRDLLKVSCDAGSSAVRQVLW